MAEQSSEDVQHVVIGTDEVNHPYRVQCACGEWCYDFDDHVEREEFSLREQRHCLVVVHGGISRRHVVHYSTFPTSKWPGRWTRKAADRGALCGSLPALMTGVDAAAWPTKKEPVPDVSDVDCRRCRERYERLFSPDKRADR